MNSPFHGNIGTDHIYHNGDIIATVKDDQMREHIVSLLEDAWDTSKKDEIEELAELGKVCKEHELDEDKITELLDIKKKYDANAVKFDEVQSLVKELGEDMGDDYREETLQSLQDALDGIDLEIDTDIVPYQSKVSKWAVECFGRKTATNIVERNHRFLEEALELVQSLDCSEREAIQLVEYVYNRPAGQPEQEVGGVMTTLAVLCNAHKMNMYNCGRQELSRVSVPETMEKIRAKQKAKKKDSALPGNSEGFVIGKLDFYNKLRVKLAMITTGVMSIEDYTKEIDIKIKQLNQ